MASNANLFEDFSGISSSSADPNPYNALIEACENDPAQIQSRYAKHREARAAKQRAYILSDAFEGVNADPILRSRLIEESLPEHRKTGYVDPRNCLVLWARPPERIKSLIQLIQAELKKVVPDMWFMPPENLHLTAFEVTNSLTPTELETFLLDFNPLVEEASEFLNIAAQSGKLARLEKPMVTFDASAVALSFLPSLPSASNERPGDLSFKKDPTFTYHHLRRDLWDICSSTSVLNKESSHQANEEIHSHTKRKGVPISSRYVVPSIHLTIGRFVSLADTSKDSVSTPGDGEAQDLEVGKEKMKQFVEKIDEVNEWLGREFTGVTDQNATLNQWEMSPGAWIVGEESGLDCHQGRLWYGGGERIRVGAAVDI